jgi:Glycosyltransferase family 9 (heptosyltransferase)
VTLLAPASSAAALLGGGLSEVQRVVDWERADVGTLLGDGPLPDTLSRDLTGHDEAVAFTRSDTLLVHLRGIVGRLAARDPQPPPGVPAHRWFADAVADLGLDPSLSPPRCTASPDEERLAASWRERLPPRFFALHPGSGSPKKNWPAERFLTLVDRVRPPEPWLAVSGPADVDVVEPFRRRTGCLLVEGLPVRTLGALLGAAAVYVGNDSGVTHLAAAWHTPTVALYGPTDARVWSPEGSRVRTIQSPTPEMSGINVDEVARAVEALT